MQSRRFGDQDNPLVPLHSRMRGFDRDLIRGKHYGQRSCEPHLKGRTHGCTDQVCYARILLANPEPSTHGTKRTSRPCKSTAFAEWHIIECPVILPVEAMRGPLCCRYAARSPNAASRKRSRLRSPSAADFRMRSASVVLSIVACSFGGRRSQASSRAAFRSAIVWASKWAAAFGIRHLWRRYHWARTAKNQERILRH